MAHTDRDDARWFWHNHFRFNKGNPQCEDWGRYAGGDCWHHTLPNEYMWARPYQFEMGVPSEWHRDQRKAERGHARNLMHRARSGHIDWDDLVISYRRPYYW